MIIPLFSKNGLSLYKGDALKILKEFKTDSVDCVITSPPVELDEDYWNKTFRQIKRVVKVNGTIWINLNDIHPDIRDKRTAFFCVMNYMVLAGCPENGTILDPFVGFGATSIASLKNNRKFIGIDICGNTLREKTMPNIEKALCSLNKI